MAHLNNLRIAVIATDGVEESELTEPVKALKDAGALVEIISPKPRSIQAFQHFDKSSTIKVDRVVDEILTQDYDGIVLPGGALNADQLRVNSDLKSFVARHNGEGRPIAAICHAPWLLISAGLVSGRRLTAYHTLEDDIRNAGGHFLNEEVVVDNNWVTSRNPRDLPAFNREMINLFSFSKVRRAAS